MTPDENSASSASLAISLITVFAIVVGFGVGALLGIATVGSV